MHCPPFWQLGLHEGGEIVGGTVDGEDGYHSCKLLSDSSKQICIMKVLAMCQGQR